MFDSVKGGHRKWSGAWASGGMHLLLAFLVLPSSTKVEPKVEKRVIEKLEFKSPVRKLRPLTPSMRRESSGTASPQFHASPAPVVVDAPATVKVLETPRLLPNVPVAVNLAFAVAQPVLATPAFTPPAAVPTKTPNRLMEESVFGQSQTTDAVAKSRSRSLLPGEFQSEVGTGRGRAPVTVSNSESGFNGGVGTSATGAPGRRTGEVSAFGAPTEPGDRIRKSPVIQAAEFEPSAIVTPSTQDRRSGMVPVAPPEILSKPRPAYTAEAKAARIEGDVVLKVNLKANGEVLVLGIVKALGYGLDEAAANATSRIHFRPATRGGVAVDYTTTLRIVFQLG